MTARAVADLVWVVFVLGPIVATVVLMTIEHVQGGD